MLPPKSKRPYSKIIKRKKKLSYHRSKSTSDKSGVSHTLLSKEEIKNNNGKDNDKAEVTKIERKYSLNRLQLTQNQILTNKLLSNLNRKSR